MPAYFRTPVVAVTLALSALLSGCTKNPTGPPATDVQLSVSVQPSAGSPSIPVSMSLRAVNAGATQIWHCSGCSCGNGTQFTVLGPNGTEVAMFDPNSPSLGCGDGPIALAPGGVLENGRSFTGVLFVTDSHDYPSPTYAAPAGTYTVLARFFYSKDPTGEWIIVKRAATFTWAP